jgi:hypothetical protein
MPTPPPTDFAAWRTRFMDLAEALCRALDAAPPSRHQDHEQAIALKLELHGAVFSLAHAAAPDPAHLLLHCHLGLPRHESPDFALLRLLHLNHALGPDSGACFCIDAATGHARYTSVVALQGVRADALLLTMKATASLASGWRELLLSQVRNPHDAQAFGVAGRA